MNITVEALIILSTPDMTAIMYKTAKKVESNILMIFNKIQRIAVGDGCIYMSLLCTRPAVHYLSINVSKVSMTK